jgi:hypothetical protein
MVQRLDKLPAVLTSFAYRSEYFSELDGMISTIKEHHPDWRLVIGRGPVPGFASPTLEVESHAGKCHWSLPVAFDLDGSENDWLRLVLMKGWWMAQVWHYLGRLTDHGRNRIVWLDADGRLNGPLDIDLEPEAEVFASPWWTDPATPEDEHHVCSGMMIFQGASGGIIETILDQWSADCIRYIPLHPSLEPWPEGDQDLLTTIVKNHVAANKNYILLKLGYDKYCGVPDKDGKPKTGALVDQWMMSEKMGLPQDRNLNWPPPEWARRRSAR